MQLDIFSCNGFSKKKVEDFLKKNYTVNKLDDIFIDRTSALKLKS